MYLDVSSEAELRQGDIFINLPWPIFDPTSSFVGNQKVDLSIQDFVSAKPVGMLLEPSTGIITSADCDAMKEEYLLVTRVHPITKKYPGYTEKSLPGKVETKVKISKSIGGFYLQSIGEELPDSWLQVFEMQLFPQEFLLRYRRNRIATLNEEARRHFREQTANFICRFGADHYYLTADEIGIARSKGYITETDVKVVLEKLHSL